MKLEPKDINLKKFLEKFTYQGDPDPDGKIELPLSVFLDVASNLKIDFTLQRLVNK